MSAENRKQMQWLVRKEVKKPPAGNDQLIRLQVLGPYTSEQILAMMEQGLFEAEDELCPENSYWFFLHETAELKKYFNVDHVVLRSRAAAADSDDEITQSDEVTQPNLASGSPSDIAKSFKRLGATSSAVRIEGHQNLRFEPSRLWGILLGTCIILTGIGIAWVLRSLRVQ